MANFSNIHGVSAAETSKFDSSSYDYVIELVEPLNLLTKFPRLKQCFMHEAEALQTSTETPFSAEMSGLLTQDGEVPSSHSEPKTEAPRVNRKSSLRQENILMIRRQI